MNNTQNGFSHDDYLDVQRIILNVSRYFPFVLTGLILGGLLGAVAGSFWPKEYVSSTYMEGSEIPVQQVLESLKVQEQEQGKPQDSVIFYEKIAMIPPILNQVKKKVLEMGYHDKLDFRSQRILNTPVLILTVKSKNEELTPKISNIWADVLIETFNSQIKNSWDKSSNLLETPNKKIEEQLFSYEKQLANSRPLLEIKEKELQIRKVQLNQDIESLSTLERQINQIEMTLPVLKSELERHSTISPSNSKDISQSTLQKLSQAGMHGVVTFGPNPIRAGLEQRISDMEVTLNLHEPRKKELEKSIADLKKEIPVLNNDIVELSRNISKLNDAAQGLRKNQNIVFTKIEEMKIAMNLPIVNLRVLSPASTAEPRSKTIFFAIFGAFLGFIVSASFVPVKKQKQQTQKAAPQPEFVRLP